MNYKLKRLIIISMLTALAMILGLLESFIPISIPGVRLGLAHVIILIMIYEFKSYEALITDLFRILIVALIRGTFLSPVFFMSLAGGLSSFVIMLIFSKIKIFTAVGTSVMGSIFHSIAQVVVCIILISSESVLYYLPFIMLLSLGTGIVSGFISDMYLKRSISKRFIDVKEYVR